MLSKRATNEELRGSFSDLSVPIVFAIEDASNPEYKVLYLAQEVRNEQEVLSTVTEVQKRLLGWRPDLKIVRCVQTISTGIMDSLSIDIGYQFKDFFIKSGIELEPAYPGQEPMKRGDDILQHNGRLIYEHTYLVYSTPLSGESMDNTKIETIKKPLKVKEVKSSDPVQAVEEAIVSHPGESQLKGETTEESLIEAIEHEILEETKQEETHQESMDSKPVIVKQQTYTLLD